MERKARRQSLRDLDNNGKGESVSLQKVELASLIGGRRHHRHHKTHDNSGSVTLPEWTLMKR